MTANRPIHPTAYLDLLRAVAIVLVVNSHLDELYPIPQLGTGGVFGNELFFFISGYGLYLGYQASREAIGGWLKRRLTRVYEPLFIVATFLVLVGDAHIRTFSDFFFLYIIPLQFWFLPTIVGCYIPIYFIMAKMETKRAYACLFGALALAYILLFAIFAEKTSWLTEHYDVQTEVTLPLRIIFYFGTMVMGVYAAKFHADTKGKLSDLHGCWCRSPDSICSSVRSGGSRRSRYRSSIAFQRWPSSSSRSASRVISLWSSSSPIIWPGSSRCSPARRCRSISCMISCCARKR